jgi:L-threonylcarbamoyladenylate synthase
MFETGKITAFPTNTSWGLAVRADDPDGLDCLAKLKGRKEGQMFSLMVCDLEMLREFAEVPADFPLDFFTEKPRTAIFKPTDKLPISKYWPKESVAFRISTIPEVVEQIIYPVTATSANFTRKPSIFSAQKIEEQFGDLVVLFPGFEELPERGASEIWDFTGEISQRLR